MNLIDPHLTSAQKLAIAKSYAARLFEDYPAIDSIIVSGSVARGQDIPVSDVDLGYLVHKGGPTLPIQKGIQQGVYIDIEPFYIEDLAPSRIMKDAYVLGYIKESLTLHDRSSNMAALKKQIEAEVQNPAYKRQQLAAIQQTAVRNLNEFAAAIEADDATELCRAAIFALWCLAERLLVQYDKPPGGFRCLSRLKLINTDAFIEIVTFQGSLAKDKTELGGFYDLYGAGQPAGSYNFQKYTWMNQNGFKDEAFHMLWILLGLAIKDKQHEDCEAVAQQWLAALGWHRAIWPQKVREMERLFLRYDLT